MVDLVMVVTVWLGVQVGKGVERISVSVCVFISDGKGLIDEVVNSVVVVRVWLGV